MTIVQPNNTTAFLNRVLIVLVVALVIGAGWVVVLYNRLVNLNHNLTDTNGQIRAVQTANAELKDRAFQLFTSQNLDQVAAARGLVKDREPRYVAQETPWSLASR